MSYRRPFFKRLSEIYETKFLFTHIEISKDVYGLELYHKIDGLEGVNYKILKKHFGIQFELIRELLKTNCHMIVDSLQSYEAIFSFVIAKLKGKPIMFWSEAWDWKKPLRRKLSSPVFNSIVKYSDAMLVPGTRHKKYFVSLGASPDNIVIMPNASHISAKNVDCINKEKLKEELGVEDKKVVLYVGRLVKRKGVDYLIKAFAKLRKERDDTVLVIIGQGSCRDELELLARNLSIEDSIYFVGYVKDELLSSYYLLCNVCVVPSITYGMGDPWVFVVNEAMYFGKPVIVTDAVGASFDMIRDGENGFIVPEKDGNAIFSALKKILSDSELEKKMGKKSQSIIEMGFKYDHMVGGFWRAVESVLEKRMLKSKDTYAQSK